MSNEPILYRQATKIKKKFIWDNGSLLDVALLLLVCMFESYVHLRRFLIIDTKLEALSLIDHLETF